MTKLAVLLAAILTSATSFAEPNGLNLPTDVPKASAFKATRPIPILGEHSGTFFQNGTVVHDRNQLDPTKPLCKITVLNKKEHDRVLKEGSTLLVASVKQESGKYTRKIDGKLVQYILYTFELSKNVLSQIDQILCEVDFDENEQNLRPLKISDVTEILKTQLELAFPSPAKITGTEEIFN